MTGYKRVNYYELCRLCTSSQTKDKIHIFREEGRKMQLQQKIQSCFPLLVAEHDYLPKVVCLTCVRALDQCFAFRQNCIGSETMLSTYFSNFRFTDDFKKSGKVYVKDTGQKKPDLVRENDVATTPMTDNNRIAVQTNNGVIDVGAQENQGVIIKDGNRQYYALELPKSNFGAANNNNNNNDDRSINSNHKSATINDKALLSDVVQTLTYSSGTDKAYRQQHVPNLDFKNVQPMMLIDVNQLMESGLPESQVSQIKEALLKPSACQDKCAAENKPDGKLENKLFKCDICDKIFKRREHLYQHSKLHSGVRPFSCVHCTKTFSRKEHLMRHLTSHSGAKDFTCDICNKKFSRPDNLKKHKKTHQKMGPFVCEICEKSFVIKHYYLAHKLQHETSADGILNNMLKVEDAL